MTELSIINLDYLADSSLYFDYYRNEPWANFLDSCPNAFSEKHSRYDIITAAPWAVLTTRASGETLVENRLTNTQTIRREPSPFEILSELLETMSIVTEPGLPFTGGALGYWGYELASLMEPGRIPQREMTTPLMSIGLYHWALITDHQKLQASIIFHPDIDQDEKKRVLALLDLDQPPPGSNEHFSLTEKFSHTITRHEYDRAFEKIQDYILNGDCYEVNLTQEFTSRYQGDSWLAYKHLREISPAPYSAYLAHPGIEILSHSPERFIKVKERQVETHPIKGTRPRGNSAFEDQKNAQSLLNSEKDQAENLMIVDLLRNDLGKVCKTGSIQVPRLFALESYANVHHLVSTITGVLSQDSDILGLMASAFPGGSITGAPKIRSMEIIRELEATARSVYCGAIGYISCNGQMDSNITIRTLVAENNRLSCWGGGAIVADSNCDQEYQESITKVKNLMNALEAMPGAK